MTSYAHKIRKPASLAALALGLAVLLSACGGGHDDNRGVVDNSAVPKSATLDIGSLIAFMLSLQAGTSETSEPIALGEAVLVVDDTSEPTPL